MDTKLNQIIVFIFIIIIPIINSCKNKIYEVAEIIILSGDDQIGDANSLLNLPIVIRITNSETRVSVEEIEVLCEVTEGSVDNEITLTDKYGKAQINWKLGSTVGEQILTISVLNNENTYFEASTILVYATANPTPSSVKLLLGNNQTGQIGTKLPESLSFSIKDHMSENYIGNIYLSLEGNGKIPDTCVTNSEGIASIDWILGMAEGEQAATISFLKEDRITHLEGSPISLSATGAPLVSVTDIDGNTYNVIKIGEQYWIDENLRVTRYADGSEIQNSGEWNNLGSSSKAYCFYNNDENDIYGAYYTQAAALNWVLDYNSPSDPEGIQGVCPDGWHIPSKDEYYNMYDIYGGSQNAAKFLKSSDTISWCTSNNGTNESGFGLLGSGYRNYDGNFSGIRWYGMLWTSTIYPEGSGAALSQRVECPYNDIVNLIGGGSLGIPVRCVKDND